MSISKHHAGASRKYKWFTVSSKVLRSVPGSNNLLVWPAAYASLGELENLGPVMQAIGLALPGASVHRTGNRYTSARYNPQMPQPPRRSSLQVEHTPRHEHMIPRIRCQVLHIIDVQTRIFNHQSF